MLEVQNFNFNVQSVLLLKLKQGARLLNGYLTLCGLSESGVKQYIKIQQEFIRQLEAKTV